MSREDPRATCQTCRWFDPSQIKLLTVGVCRLHPVAIDVARTHWCSYHCFLTTTDDQPARP